MVQAWTFGHKPETKGKEAGPGPGAYEKDKRQFSVTLPNSPKWT